MKLDQKWLQPGYLQQQAIATEKMLEEMFLWMLCVLGLQVDSLSHGGCGAWHLG